MVIFIFPFSVAVIRRMTEERIQIFTVLRKPDQKGELVGDGGGGWGWRGVVSAVELYSKVRSTV